MRGLNWNCATATVLLVLTAGCASTVQQQSAGTDQAAFAGDGLSTQPATGGATGPDVGLGAAPETNSTTGSGGTTTAPGAAVANGANPKPVQGGPGPQVPRPGSDGSTKAANVPGVSDTTLKLGVEYFSTSELAAFGNATGVQAVGATETLEAYKAAAEYVNKRGGVAGGRRIVLVPRQRSTSENNSSAAQATCAAFTEDDRVFAANADFTQDSPLVPCLSRRGVLSVTAGLVEAGSRDDFARFGGLYMGPSTAETISAADTYIDALVRQGLVTKGSTIGLLWLDFTDFQAARKHGLLPALARHGMKLKSEYQAHYSGNPSDLGPIAAQMQSAALQFRSDGVDRVLTLDYQGTLTYFFMQQAQQQGYKPRYGLASWSNAEFLVANGQTAQLAGASGFGWLPGVDVAPTRQPKLAPLEECKALMQAKGMSVKAQSDAVIQYTACSRVFFLKTLLDNAPDLSPAGLRTALSGLGKQPSYSGFGDAFSANRAWGAAVYRDLVYDASCGCAAYRGPDRSFN